MMRKNLAKLATLAAALALPLAAAAAQAASPSQDRGEAWLAVSAPCREARDNPAVTGEVQLAVCEKALAALHSRFADPAQTPRDDMETNFYWFAEMVTRVHMAGAMGAIDKVRSKRVCEQILLQEAAAAHYKPDAWPKGYAAIVSQIAERAVAPVAKCRADLG